MTDSLQERYEEMLDARNAMAMRLDSLRAGLRDVLDMVAQPRPSDHDIVTAVQDLRYRVVHGEVVRNAMAMRYDMLRANLRAVLEMVAPDQPRPSDHDIVTAVQDLRYRVVHGEVVRDAAARAVNLQHVRATSVRVDTLARLRVALELVPDAADGEIVEAVHRVRAERDEYARTRTLGGPVDGKRCAQPQGVWRNESQGVPPLATEALSGYTVPGPADPDSLT